MKLTNTQKTLFIITLGYSLLTLAFLFKYDFNPSAAVFASSELLTTYPNNIPKNTIIHTNVRGYDGYFYYAIANNLATDTLSIDGTARLQRILYPAIAATLSFNTEKGLSYVMLAINFVSIIFGCYILLLLIQRLNGDRRLVYLWAFNVGYLIAYTRNLTEPLLFLFLLLAVYFILNNKPYKSSLAFICALVTKETALFLYIPTILFFAYKKRWKELVIFLPAVIPLLFFEYYIYSTSGSIPLLENTGPLSFPLVGLFRYVTELFTITSFREFVSFISIFPLLIFTLLHLRIFLKDTSKLSYIPSVTVFLILILLSLDYTLYMHGDLDGMGRHSMVLILFSLLYFALKKRTYTWPYTTLLIISSITYMLELFLMPVSYVLSG